jgi:hypothetical protein
MHYKIILLIMVFVMSDVASASTLTKSKVTAAKVPSDKVAVMVTKQLTKIAAKEIGTDDFMVVDDQTFLLSSNNTKMYLVSATHKPLTHEFPSNVACSLLLFDSVGRIISALDLVGANHLRPWTCDNPEAISFSDYYPDGNLKIIALYNATAPSSEHFYVPVILRMEFREPSLKVDESLTAIVTGKDVTTIKEVRALLPK